MKQITLYTKPLCPYCARAKGILERNGIPYVEIKLTEDNLPSMIARLPEGTPVKFPQVFAGDKHIPGGSDGLIELERKGDLAAFLDVNL